MIGMGSGLGLSTNGVWTPKRLSGLVLWLRADVGVTTVSGLVSAWADQSGTADANKNMSQATSTKRPVFNASDAAYNNQATLSFISASATYLASGTWSSSLTQAYTIFVVGQDSNGTNQEWLDGSAASARLLWLGGTGYDAIGTLQLTGGSGSASPKLIGATYNGASSKLYVGARTPVATGSVGTGNIADVVLGIYGGDLLSNPLSGKIAEVIAVTGSMSSADVNSLANYVTHRYGISVGV